jgi:hypothetical protein
MKRGGGVSKDIRRLRLFCGCQGLEMFGVFFLSFGRGDRELRER